MSEPANTPAPGSMIGRRIGNYEIESLLAAGGMGQVFKARHVLLDRPAALKLMHVHMAQDPTFQARFRREARAVAALRHPHIVEVFDFDEADGYAYLVMELITGGTMRELLRDGVARDPNWSLARGLDLIRQAADALAYAHALGMVHRDIKPENLLLQSSSPGAPLVVKVGDFGLARVTEVDASIATQAGMAMGTLAYMAPEQAGGKELDGRTDIYALGVILYELATGELPFQIKTITEAVFKHTFTPPPPPRSKRPELPESVEGLILRCLAKSPDERFASAADLSAALREVLGAVLPDMAAASLIVAPSLGTQVGTQVRSGGVGPAPEARSLIGETSLPRIQVLDESGTLLQVVAVRPGGMSVGRVAANDVQLDAPTVSRHHLQITWDGTRVQATDLGSRGGAELNGARLTPQVPQEWPWGTMLHLGSYWLRLDAPTGRSNQASGPESRPVAAQGAPPVLPSGASGALSGAISFSRSFVTTGEVGLVVEPEALTLTPGRTTPLDVTLANMSNAADHLALSVAGVPESWLQLPPTQQIAAWGQSQVRLMITVPEAADVAAGEYPVEVRARSRTNPEQGGKVLARWTVRPFVRSELTIAPARVEGRGRGRFRVTIQNAGNAAARFRLSAHDDESLLRFSFEPEQLTIDPGASESITLLVEGPSPLVGRPQASRFAVQAQAEGSSAGTQVEGAGQFVRLARLPSWAIAAAALMLIVLVGVLALQVGTGGQQAGVGTDLRATITAQAVANQALANTTATAIAAELNQTSTAIAALPIATRGTAQAILAAAAQATQSALNASQATQAALAVAQSTELVLAVAQTQTAGTALPDAQTTPGAGTPGVGTSIATVPVTPPPTAAAAGSPTLTIAATATIKASSTIVLLPTSTSVPLNAPTNTAPPTAVPTTAIPATATNPPTATLTPAPTASNTATLTPILTSTRVVTPTLGPSATPTLVLTPGPPSTITILAGNGQSTSINTTFPVPLQVRALDATGAPVVGYSLGFTVVAFSSAEARFPGGDPQIFVTTDSAGIAIAQPLTANTFIGSYEVRVFTTQTLATFTLNNVP